MRGHLDVKDLEKYKKPDIQALARELGVSDAGTIKEIAARCAAVEVEIPDDDQQDQGENQATPEGQDRGESQVAPEGQNRGESQAAPEGEQQKSGTTDGMVMVKVVEHYHDLELGRIVKKDTVLPMKEERAAVIIGKKLGKKVEE